MNPLSLKSNSGFSAMSAIMGAAVIGIFSLIISDSYLGTRKMQALSSRTITLNYLMEKIRYFAVSEETCSLLEFIGDNSIVFDPNSFKKVIQTLPNLNARLNGTLTPLISSEELELAGIEGVQIRQVTKNFAAYEPGLVGDGFYPATPPLNPENPQYFVELRFVIDDNEYKKLYGLHSERAHRTVFLIVETDPTTGVARRCAADASITQVCRLFSVVPNYNVFPPWSI